MTDTKNIYPRTGDRQTIYLGNVITSPYIEVATTRCTMISSMIR